jgi:uncharacterized protein (TIGR02453 family)
MGIISIIREVFMRSRFPGFPPEALQFFRALARHNNRDWFQPRKATVRRAGQAAHARVGGSAEWRDEKLRSGIRHRPRKAIYRIYRDTRFSKDKTPYKDHIAASFFRSGTGPHKYGGYYVHVSHKEVAVGGGVYMPEPEVLLGIRGHIAENHQKLRKILAAPAVRRSLGELQGDQLSRVPKGFPRRTPRPTCCASRAFPVRESRTGTGHHPAILQRSAHALPRHEAVPGFPDRAIRQETRKIDPRDLFV